MRSKSMQALTNDHKARYPGVVVYGIGDEEHQERSSDHNEDDTSGSNAAQSDADNNPEHRAIDVMLGPAFNRDQAYDVINNEILARPENLARLWYFNFENQQWSRNNGWKPIDNSDDPHPDHIHFSGLASDDENGAPWFGGDMSWQEMLKAGADAGGGTYPAQDWLIGANWKAWDAWANTEDIKAQLTALTQLVTALLESGGADTAAILAGVDERLAAQREHIKATAEAHRRRIEDAVADLGEGGAAKVRSEIDSPE